MASKAGTPSTAESASDDGLGAPPSRATLVRELAEVLNDAGLTEIEVEEGELRIRITKGVSSVAAPAAFMAPPMMAAPQGYAPAPAAAPPAPAAGAAEAPAAAPIAAGETVKSPMVGTVYLQAQPGAPPFVRVGDSVNEGQTVLLVEAMKTMNPIAAPKAGKVVQVLVADGQPVEFGEPLLVIG